MKVDVELRETDSLSFPPTQVFESWKHTERQPQQSRVMATKHFEERGGRGGELECRRRSHQIAAAEDQKKFVIKVNLGWSRDWVLNVL